MMTSLFGRTAIRSLHVTAKASSRQAGVYPNVSGYKKLQAIQSKMCRDDGRLVWQKLGTRDTLMYQVTMAVMLFGFIPMGYSVYKFAFPPAKPS